MRIRILGAGVYGAHLAAALLADGHDVEIWESRQRIFEGATGNNPARVHLGFHYPRSRETRAGCQAVAAEFMRVYGDFTRTVPINIYAVAARESLVDFGTYKQVLADVDWIDAERPAELGLQNVEGALLTGERHIDIGMLRAHFGALLADRIRFGVIADVVDDPAWDMTVDCTFCALDGENVDRYEPCLTLLLEGPTDRSVTIMDGPFPSLYVWSEAMGLSSLTSAKLTPFSKECRTYAEARAILDGLGVADTTVRAAAMMAQMAEYWPAVRDVYSIAEHRLAIRAMPRSAASSRSAELVRVGAQALRIRAGKITNIFDAERAVKAEIAAAGVPRVVVPAEARRVAAA